MFVIIDNKKIEVRVYICLYGKDKRILYPYVYDKKYFLCSFFFLQLNFIFFVSDTTMLH